MPPIDALRPQAMTTPHPADSAGSRLDTIISGGIIVTTIRSARALHLDARLGSLEPGKRADLVVLEMEAINQLPLSSIYSALVDATMANDVRDVLVEGQPLLPDRRLQILDQDAINQEALALRHQIIERLGMAPPPP